MFLVFHYMFLCQTNNQLLRKVLTSNINDLNPYCSFLPGNFNARSIKW